MQVCVMDTLGVETLPNVFGDVARGEVLHVVVCAVSPIIANGFLVSKPNPGVSLTLFRGGTF